MNKSASTEITVARAREIAKLTLETVERQRDRAYDREVCRVMVRGQRRFWFFGKRFNISRLEAELIVDGYDYMERLDWEITGEACVQRAQGLLELCSIPGCKKVRITLEDIRYLYLPPAAETATK